MMSINKDGPYWTTERVVPLTEDQKAVVRKRVISAVGEEAPIFLAMLLGDDYEEEQAIA